MKYFTLQELVAPELIAELGEAECLARLGDAPDLLDRIREAWGKPITVNGKGQKYCGVRPLKCAVGAPNSDHKLWRTFDLHTEGIAELHEMLRSRHTEFYIVRMERHEYTPTWCHVTFGTFKEFNP